MVPTRTPVALLACLPWIAGCIYVAPAVALVATGGGGGGSTTTIQPTTVDAPSAERTSATTVSVTFTVRGPAGGAALLAVETDAAGGPSIVAAGAAPAAFWRVTVASAGGGARIEMIDGATLLRVPTMPGGQAFTIVWDLARSGLAGARTGKVRVVPVDDRGHADAFALERAGVTAAPVTLGNDAPVATLDSSLSGERAGTIAIPYGLSDTSADLASVVAEFSTDAGASFVPATTQFSLTTRLLTVSPAGSAEPSSHVFFWDSQADGASATYEGPAIFRLTPSDAYSAGQPATTAAVIDNNQAPQALIAAPARSTAGAVTVAFELRDRESNPARIVVTYSTEDGLASGPAVLTDTATMDLGTSPSGTAHAVTWLYERDLGSNHAARVRLRVRAIDAAGDEDVAGTSAAFVVGNDPPTVTITAVPAATGGNIPIDYALFDSTGDLASVVVTYSTDGVTPTAATGPGARVGLATTAPDSATRPAQHTFVWTSAADLPAIDGAPVTIRIDAADGLPGDPATPATRVIAVDNVVASGTPAPAVTADSISLSLASDADGNATANPGDAALVVWDAVAAGTSLTALAGAAAFADLSELGGGTDVTLKDDGTQGDASAGDGRFSLRYTVVPAAADRAAARVRVRTVSPTGSNGLPVASAATVSVDAEVPVVTDGATPGPLALVIATDTLEQGTVNAGDTISFAWSSKGARVSDAVLVEADLTAFGLGMTALRDDGTGGDFFAGDGLFTKSFAIGEGSFQRFTPDWSVRVTDDAGNRSGWSAAPPPALRPLDNRRPSLVAVTTLDRDGDARVESARLAFDEPVRDATLDPAGVLIAGVTCTSVETDGAADDGQVVVSVSPAAAIAGTSAKDVTFDAGRGRIEDLAGQTLRSVTGGAIAEEDGARPVLVAAVASDGLVSAAGVDADDSVLLTFSEPVNAQMVMANPDGVLSLGNGHSWGGIWVEPPIVTSGAAVTEVTVFFRVASTATIAVNDRIRPDGASIQDGAGLAVAASAMLGGSFVFVSPASSTVSAVVAVAAGAYHDLALLPDGSVRASGDDGAGQLGGASSGGAIPLLGGVAAIAAGGNHSLALLADGTVRAWGDDLYGQGGGGSVTSPIPGLAGVRAIAAGDYHSLALLADGTVRAWGRDDAGQLGGASGGGTIPLLATVTAIAAGGRHSLALLADGTVRAWGEDVADRLGGGSSTTSIPGLSGVVAIAAGTSHSLALLADGTVRAWGSDAFGQLGGGSASTSIPLLTSVTAIAAGANHSLARLADGTVRAWGDSSAGQLQGGSLASSIPGLAGVEAIAAGGNHNVYAIANGTVRAWGNSSWGLLGGGTITTSIPGLERVVAIVCGGNHTLVLGADGTVRGWGFDTRGQLGGGTVTTPVPGLAHVRAIEAGGDHSLAILADGTIRAWGWDQYGQLGGASATASVTGLAGVRAVAGGSQHSLALLADGTVRAWGDDAFGQLGGGSVTGSIPGLAGVTAIASGEHHGLALLADGTVRAWGKSASNILAGGSVTTSIPGLAGVRAIAAGGNFSLALLADGTVRAWGESSEGQLGGGSAAASVPGLAGVTNVAGGQTHALARLADGTARAWGQSSDGSLGGGSITASVPGLAGVQVVQGGVLTSFALKR